MSNETRARPSSSQASLFDEAQSATVLNDVKCAEQLPIFRELPPPIPLSIAPIPGKKPKRKYGPMPGQFHFGVVHVTEEDRARWRRETKRLRQRNRRRMTENQCLGPPNEWLEWHEALYWYSLKQFHESGPSVRKEILEWILAPMAPTPEQVVPLSFQACCIVAGRDPEREYTLFEKYFQKESKK